MSTQSEADKLATEVGDSREETKAAVRFAQQDEGFATMNGTALWRSTDYEFDLDQRIKAARLVI